MGDIGRVILVAFGDYWSLKWAKTQTQRWLIRLIWQFEFERLFLIFTFIQWNISVLFKRKLSSHYYVNVCQNNLLLHHHACWPTFLLFKENPETLRLQLRPIKIFLIRHLNQATMKEWNKLLILWFSWKETGIGLGISVKQGCSCLSIWRLIWTTSLWQKVIFTFDTMTGVKQKMKNWALK